MSFLIWSTSWLAASLSFNISALNSSTWVEARLDAMRKALRPLAACLEGGLRPGSPSPRLGRFEEPSAERRAVQQREALQNHLQGRSPSVFVTTRSRGEEALGGFSRKEGAQPSETECAETVTSTPLFLLKTRPVQVSSSSEAVASTTPFCLRSAGVEAEGLVAGVGAGGALEGPTPFLSLEAASASIFLFSTFSTMST